MAARWWCGTWAAPTGSGSTVSVWYVGGSGRATRSRSHTSATAWRGLRQSTRLSGKLVSEREIRGGKLVSGREISVSAVFTQKNELTRLIPLGGKAQCPHR